MSESWLRDGVVVPSHRVVRLQARLPLTAAVRWRAGHAEPPHLTFDDGPRPVSTDAVLEALARHRRTATFFVLVEAARRHRDLLAAMLAARHRVQLHGERHEPLVGRDGRTIGRALRDAKAELEDLTQRPVHEYRPPYGTTSIALLRGARRAALTVVLWSHDPRDWDAASTVPIADRISRCLQPGAIVLLHDGIETGGGAERGATSTAMALERALASTAMAARGG